MKLNRTLLLAITAISLTACGGAKGMSFDKFKEEIKGITDKSAPGKYMIRFDRAVSVTGKSNHISIYHYDEKQQDYVRYEEGEKIPYTGGYSATVQYYMTYNFEVEGTVYQFVYYSYDETREENIDERVALIDDTKDYTCDKKDDTFIITTKQTETHYNSKGWVTEYKRNSSNYQEWDYYFYGNTIDTGATNDVIVVK